MTKVVNLKYYPCDIYIGRKGWFYGNNGYFGNPYIIGKDGNREQVIEKYRIYFNNRIETDTEFKKKVLELKDKTIACWCDFPKEDCHLRIIKEYIESELKTNDF